MQDFADDEALRIGVGTISIGEVGLIIAALGMQTGLLQKRGFTISGEILRVLFSGTD